MARLAEQKVQMSLDADSKRLIRNLTRAIDRLARVRDEATGPVRRLIEDRSFTQEEGSLTIIEDVCGNGMCDKV